MAKPKFTLNQKDPRITARIPTTDHKILAQWAIDCAERVLPYFEEAFPLDPRPREAIDTLKEWMRTGIFSMKVIRSASLNAHQAAKEVGEDNPARSAAHAAGQAVATAHVRTHCIGPALYALQAIYRSFSEDEVAAKLKKEKEWQYQHLLSLINHG